MPHEFLGVTPSTNGTEWQKGEGETWTHQTVTYRRSLCEPQTMSRSRQNGLAGEMREIFF